MSGPSKKHADRGRKVASPPETPEIAVSLAKAGWPVFPVTIYEDASGKRHKVPAVKWKEWATTDVKTVAKAWAGEHSGRWIGVYAGKAGIVVLDVDPGGDDSIAEAGFDVPRPFSPLFLGGPWHGQRRELAEPMSDIIVPVPSPPQRVFSIVDSETTIDEIPERQTVRYELTKLAWPKAKRVVALYFPAGYSDADKEHAVADWLEGGA